MNKNLIFLIENFSDPVSFEKLCCDVLSRSGYTGIALQGTGGPDGGKDALLEHPVIGKIVFHFSLQKNWGKKLSQDIESIKRYHIGCKQLIFCTNRKTSALKKDQLKKMALTKLNCELEIYDQERIRAVVFNHKELLGEYFPEYVNSHALSDLAATLRNLSEVGLMVPKISFLDALQPVVEKAALDAVASIEQGEIMNAVEKARLLVKGYIELKFSVIPALIAIGLASWDKGDIKVALLIFQIGLHVDPENFYFHFNIAVCHEYNQKGLRYGKGFDIYAAIESYDKAFPCADEAHKRSRCLENKANLLIKLKKIDEAKALLTQALEYEPGCNSILLNLATLENDSDIKLKALNDLVNTDVGKFARFNIAAEYNFRKEFIKVKEILEDIEPDKDLPFSYHIFVEAYLQIGNFDKAKKYVEQGIAAGIEDEWLYDYSGKIAMQMGRWEDAIGIYRRMLSAGSYNEGQLTRLGYSLFQTDDKSYQKEIIELLSEAIRRNNSLYIAHHTLGQVYIDTGMLASAENEFQKVIAINPKYTEAYFNLGVIADIRAQKEPLKFEEQKKIANGFYFQVLQVDPLYWKGYFNIGTNCIEIGDIITGIDYLQKGLVFCPNNDMLLANLGCGFWGLGRKEEALHSWERAVEINPSNTFALFNLQSKH